MPSITMLQAIAGICSAGRAAMQVSRNKAGVSEAVIVSFENAKAWPRKPDEIVEAYAAVLNAPPSELWKDAAGVMDDGFG